MNYNEVVKIGNIHLFPVISELYGLEGSEIRLINSDGECNVVYDCVKEGTGSKIIRISFLGNRSRQDVLSEVEYIRYLYENGGSVANVISSMNGNLLEEIPHDNHKFFVCLFEKAKGKRFVDNNYQYREGVPITEYFYNCGKTLGKLHQLSKEYTPVHHRYSFFDKYNAEYINKLVPDSFPLLKEKLINLLKSLEELERDCESYGMVHFDYCDGNYHIDFETGQIIVYDFDNSCICWYMFDLAGIWGSGEGWIQNEQDVSKRKKFMEDYFTTVVEGYRSETTIEESMLDKLPLFINVNCLEAILAGFEQLQVNGEYPLDMEESEIWHDYEMSSRIKCLEDDIPYRGFFREM
jgi:Ser/Thr protein kinase RdoA (MazF antagonist)